MQFSAFGYGVVIAAGPWLLTTAGLAVVTLLAAIDDLGLSEFRVVVIYAFAFGLLGSAPATVVGARQLADCLYARRPEFASDIFLKTLAASAGLTAVIMAALAVAMQLPVGLSLAAVACGVLVALLWVASAFCGATRDYRPIGIAFAAGTTLGAGLAILAASTGAGPTLMVWGYSVGPAIAAGLLIARILETFPLSAEGRRRPSSGSLHSLALGALLNAAALWADRFVVWLSPVAERTQSGLVNAPLYDAPMFIASLSLIPGLALFVINLETSIAFGLRRLHLAVLDHATLEQVEAEAIATRRAVLGALHRIVIVQAALCLLLVGFGNDIFPLAGLQPRQVVIARLGTIAMLFQFIFFASSAVILYLDMRREYLVLQLCMLVSVVGFTALSIAAGPQYLGAGVLVAAVGNGVAAYLAMTRSIEQLSYNTFVAPLIRGRTASRREARQRPSRSGDLSRAP